MKLKILKTDIEDTLKFMRRCGYGYLRSRSGGKDSFVKRLRGELYPRFHLYIEDDGENEWIVTKARITNRNVAYQMYLKELKGEPIEVSAEYKWTMDYDNDGNPLQTNIRPALISLVDKGHITGNQIKIKSQI